MAAQRILAPTLAALVVFFQAGDSFVLPSTAGNALDRMTTATATCDASRWISTVQRHPRPSSNPSSAARYRTSGARLCRGRMHVAGAKAAAAAAADEVSAPETREAGSSMVKNDQEWQFFDTARINVNAGAGGNG